MTKQEWLGVYDSAVKLFAGNETNDNHWPAGHMYEGQQLCPVRAAVLYLSETRYRKFLPRRLRVPKVAG